MSESVLKAESLCKSYRRRMVVQDLDISFRQGEIAGLLGPNGAGKTTTFYMLVGLIKPEGGRIFLDDEEITAMPTYQRARVGITYLPQEPSIFRGLTVRQNLLAILETLGMSGADCRRRADELMNLFGISHRADQLAERLSGGEKRRTEIARALVLNPRFLLLDEPFVGIDPKTVDEIKTVLRNLQQNEHIGIVVTDHNVRELPDLVDRCYVIDQGRILYRGSWDEVERHAEVRQRYLGESFRR